MRGPPQAIGQSVDNTRILGDVDASTGRSALFVVGSTKGTTYEGPLGAVAQTRQITLTDFGRKPLGGL